MTDFKDYKAAFLERNDLKHFGILGMKWGVRRYQNPDGTLTPAGKKRYDKYMEKSGTHRAYSIYGKDEKLRKDMAKLADSYAQIAKKYGSETPEEREQYLELMKKREEESNKKESDSQKYWRENSTNLFTEHDVDKDPKRAKAAADLGLKAMNKIGEDGYDPEKGITNSDRNWFLWEDQTIGYATVADLVLQGKSKEQINKLISAAKKLPYEERMMRGAFQLDEGDISDAYIDALFAILNAEGRLK